MYKQTQQEFINRDNKILNRKKTARRKTSVSDVHRRWQWISGRELEQEGGLETSARMVEQRHHTALDGEQAAAQRQADAVALALGGKERDENRGTRLGWNKFAIVAHIEGHPALAIATARHTDSP